MDDSDEHDFALTVRIGEDVVRDNGSADQDPESNRIVLNDYAPPSFDGQLSIDGLLIEVEPRNRAEVEVAATSTPDLVDPSPQFGIGPDTPTPFVRVPVTVTANLVDFFSGDPAGYTSTVHLHGSYLPLDESGEALPEGTLSHAWIELGAVLEAGDAAASDAETLRSVSGKRVEGEPGPITFAPDDVEQEIDRSPLSTLRANLEMELGPAAGVHLPVSGVVTVRAR